MPIATRGERLVLAQVLARASGSEAELLSEVEILTVWEIDDQGRGLHLVLLDPDALDAAYDELDARYIAGEGSHLSEALSIWSRCVEAYQREDWTALARLFAPDIVVADRRPIGWEPMDRSRFVDRQEAFADLVGNSSSRLTSLPRVSVSSAVVVVEASGHNDSGGTVETNYVAFATFADGLISTLEFYALDDLDEAVARHDELCPEPAPEPPWYLQNTAVRVATEALGAIGRADWSTLSGLASPGITVDDRRRIVGLKAEGAAAAQRMATSAYEAGVREYAMAPVAVRGDRLALLGGVARGEGFEDAGLGLGEIDDAGRLLAVSFWDTDDLDTALDELDARWLSQYGEDFSVAAGLWLSFLRAYRTRDQDVLLDELSDDFAYVDHRPGGWGTLDRFDFVRTVWGLMDLAPDLRPILRSVETITPRGGTAILSVTGHDVSGGPFEIDMASLSMLRSGKVSRIEFFPIDDPDAIEARFQELMTEYGVDPMDDAYLEGLEPDQAEVWRATRALADAYNQRDWDGMRAVLTEDCTIVDDRITGWGRLDRDAFVDRALELISLAPDATLTCVVVHKLSSTGSIGRFRIGGTIPGGGEFTMFFESAGVVRDGKLVRLELLPEGQVEEATRRL